MMLAVVLLQLSVAFFLASQSSLSTCRFEDVVAAPNGRPAMLIRATRRDPDLSGLLLRSQEAEVKAWVRVAADGRVTDVCVPDAPEEFRERIVAVARRVRYEPAQSDGRAIATLAGVNYQIGGRHNGRALDQQIAASNDIAWLEWIAGSEKAALGLWRSQATRIGAPKDCRITAYARLGELATEDSLAAQKRIENILRGTALLASSASVIGTWTHPGWHMSDFHPIPVAETRSHDGKQLIIVPADILGPWQLFLVQCEAADRSRCTRPKPIGPWALRYIKVDASLRELAPGHLQMTIVPRERVRPSIMDGTAPLGDQPATIPGPETRDLVLADILRDSDGDGWTDLEERTLALDPSRSDSDNDGIDDAHDGSPLYAPATAEGADEDAQILQRAIFAVFGLTESRWALFARDDKVRRIQVWGLSGPVLFNRPLKPGPLMSSPGGVFVSWKIARKTSAEAVVEITDWEGPLAAGGQELFLRRVNGDWVVVARQTTWIS